MHACVIWIINFNTSFAAAGANTWFACDHCPHVALLLLMSGLGTMRGFIPANTSRCRDAATVVHHQDQTPSPAVHRCLADIKAMFDNTNTQRKCLFKCPLPPCRNGMLVNMKLLGTKLHSLCVWISILMWIYKNTSSQNIALHHWSSNIGAYMSAAQLSSGPWSTVATCHTTPEQVHEWIQ